MCVCARARVCVHAIQWFVHTHTLHIHTHTHTHSYTCNNASSVGMNGYMCVCVCIYIYTYIFGISADCGMLLRVLVYTCAHSGCDNNTRYKDIFYSFRGSKDLDKGDLSGRVALREGLQCKSFEWFLKTVCRDQYVPDFHPTSVTIQSVSGMGGGDSTDYCIDGENKQKGDVSLTHCRGRATQSISFTQSGTLRAVLRLWRLWWWWWRWWW